MGQKVEAIKEALKEANSEALLLDNYDSALIGVATRFGMDPVAAYDYEKIIAILMQDGLDREGAEEFFNFNVVGSWRGPSTPIFVELIDSV